MSSALLSRPFRVLRRFSLHVISTRAFHRVHLCFYLSILARCRIKRTRHTSHTRVRKTVDVPRTAERRCANAPTRLNDTRTRRARFALPALALARLPVLGLSAWNPPPPAVPGREFPHPLGFTLLASGHDADPPPHRRTTAIAPHQSMLLVDLRPGMHNRASHPILLARSKERKQTAVFP